MSDDLDSDFDDWEFKTRRWVCDECDFTTDQLERINQMTHLCGDNIHHTRMRLAEISEISEISVQTEKKRVASSLSTTNKPTMIQEDSTMATKRATPATKKTAAKKTAAKKTAAKPKAAKAKEVDPDSGDKATRRSFGPRGWLAEEIDKVCRKAKELPLPVGEIVKAITNPEGEHPSTGAVSAAITRWGEQGYCKVKTERPLSFNGFTAKYKSKTLQDFLDDQKAARAKARAAAKADG